jgi:hypothetical protein
MLSVYYGSNVTILSGFPCICFFGSFFSELVAFQLFEFIHFFIEDVGDAIVPDLKDKLFSNYFAAFLESKDFENLDEIVDVIHRDIQMRHAIAMFVIIAKKIEEK